MPITAVLWTGFFIINFNIAMIVPLLPFIQQALGLSPGQTSVLLAAFSPAALLGNLVCGPWIDRYGRRRFLVAGGVGGAGILAVTACASSFAVLTLSRIGAGIFMPMIGASVFAAIADYFPPDKRARVSGIVATAAPIAFLLAMSLGVLLAGIAAWQVPVVLIAVVAAAMAAFASRLPPTPAAALARQPVTWASYKGRLLSLSLGRSTRLLLLAHFCWGTAMFTFLGLYPTWVIQHGLPGRGPGAVSLMLLVGEVGGLMGALCSGRLPGLPSRPLGWPALAGFGTAAIVLTVPLGRDMLVFQTIAYALYAFGRDMMLALILGGALSLVVPQQRGSLNAILNVVYQSGATTGLVASSVLYSLRPDFTANALASAAVFVTAGISLWRITKRAAEAAPVL